MVSSRVAVLWGVRYGKKYATFLACIIMLEEPFSQENGSYFGPVIIIIILFNYYYYLASDQYQTSSDVITASA